MNLPCLIEQPMLVVVDENGTCMEINGLWESSQKAPPNALKLEPFVKSKENEELLEFYPL